MIRTYIEPPKIKHKLWDFYFAVGFLPLVGHPKERLALDAECLIDEIVDTMTDFLTLGIRYSLSAESRHVFDGHGGDSGIVGDLMRLNFPTQCLEKKREYKKLQSYLNDEDLSMRRAPTDTERERIGVNTQHAHHNRDCAFVSVAEFQKNNSISDLQLAQLFETYYSIFPWVCGYGGYAWAAIARAYKRILLAKTRNEKIIACDHIIDIAHNGGPAINKVPLYIQEGIVYDADHEEIIASSENWFYNILEEKKHANSPKVFKGLVSSQLDRLIPYTIQYFRR